MDVKWWKITVYHDKEGWKYLWTFSSAPFPSRVEAQRAAEAEVVRKLNDIIERAEQLKLI